MELRFYENTTAGVATILDTITSEHKDLETVSIHINRTPESLYMPINFIDVKGEEEEKEEEEQKEEEEEEEEEASEYWTRKMHPETRDQWTALDRALLKLLEVDGRQICIKAIPWSNVDINELEMLKAGYQELLQALLPATTEKQEIKVDLDNHNERVIWYC